LFSLMPLPRRHERRRKWFFLWYWTKKNDDEKRLNEVEWESNETHEALLKLLFFRVKKGKMRARRKTEGEREKERKVKCLFNKKEWFISFSCTIWSTNC
jgi:hypothetical protein